MDNLDIIIFGASGDLARKKIFPAFFSLYSKGLLPQNIKIYGFARTKMTQEVFKEKITENLTCRYTPQHSCKATMDEFLDLCTYCQGDYDDDAAYKTLKEVLKKENEVSRLFYLAIPPSVFSAVSNAIGRNDLIFPDNKEKLWSRVIIEKPFGKDRKSSDKLIGDLSEIFSEKQTYRIDHYLGKEVVQNLLIFRFANQVFQPIWSAQYIEKIEITWSEFKGIDERGGYFDSYGIIRDVIQNHLFQVLALTAMEEPASISPNDIRNSKVELLRRIKPVKLSEVTLGQYSSAKFNGVRVSGYLEDPTVAKDSITPTFANMVLYVNNQRWRNMPFFISAGKALSDHKAEIRIVFKKPAGNIFCQKNNCPPANELVIRIHPDEGFNLRVATKIPGNKIDFMAKDLDLSYITAFPQDTLPDAYENLILDAIRGDKTLFIRNDELQVAWDIITPLLHELEEKKIKPSPYPFGSLETYLPYNSC